MSPVSRRRFLQTAGVAAAAGVAGPAAVGQAPPDKAKAPPQGAPKANPQAPAASANPMPGQAAPPVPTEIGGKTIDPAVRDHAIKTVIFFGPNARKAIPALVRQARSLGDLSPQAAAILALGEIIPRLNVENDKALAPDIRNAVEALISALDSGQGIIRWRAAVSLTQIGAQARAAWPKLAQKVTDYSSWEIRHAACMALGRVAFDDQNFTTMQALSALMGAIADREVCKEVRIEALQSIINLGPPPAGDIRNFKTALENRLSKDKDKSVAIWVRVAMMRLDSTAVTDANISAIAKLTKDSDLDVRSQAARALGYIGPAAKSAIPDLIDALKSDEPLLIVQSAWALSRMGEEADRAVPALQALVDTNKNEDVKATAKSAIDEIKKKKK